MNTSPCQIKQYNVQQGQSALGKPRVAFVYQNNFTGLNVLNQVHLTSQLGQQKYQNSVINGQLLENGFTTPKRIDKQNSYISPSQPYEIRVISNGPIQKNTDSHNLKTNQTNFYLATNRSNSPKLQCLPPLSPKLSTRRSHNKCPSFLTQKSKTQEQIVNQTSSPQIQNKILPSQQNTQNCKCGKLATHQTSKNQKFCSKCGVAKMIQGLQLNPILNINKRQVNFETSPKSIVLDKITNVSNDKAITEKFVKQVKESKINLEKYFRQSIQCQDRNIHQFYKQRKTQLKKHYEKIKSAIKQSIEQDLKQLDVLQQQQMFEWRRSVQNVTQDIKKLEKISIQLQTQNNDKKNSKIKQIHLDQFQEILTKNKIQKNQRSKIDNAAEIDTMNVSRISNMTSHNISSLNVTIVLKNFNVNAEVYKPQIYRMVGLNGRSQLSQRNSDLLSASSQQNYIPRSQSPVLVSYHKDSDQLLPEQKRILGGNNQKRLNTNILQQQKNVLFSFEGRK